MLNYGIELIRKLGYDEGHFSHNNANDQSHRYLNYELEGLVLVNYFYFFPFQFTQILYVQFKLAQGADESTGKVNEEYEGYLTDVHTLAKEYPHHQAIEDILNHHAQPIDHQSLQYLAKLYTLNDGFQYLLGLAFVGVEIEAGVADLGESTLQIPYIIAEIHIVYYSSVLVQVQETLDITQLFLFV